MGIPADRQSKSGADDELFRGSPPSTDWRGALFAATRTFAIVLGGAGLGLLGGLAYGAWTASNAPDGPGDLPVFFVWLIVVPLFGAIGFVGGLAVGLLMMVLIWIVRLARRFVAAAR